MQAVDEGRRSLRVAGCREDRAVVCLEHVQPVGDVGGVVLTRLKRQIKIGTEERGAEFGLCGMPHKAEHFLLGGAAQPGERECDGSPRRWAKNALH